MLSQHVDNCVLPHLCLQWLCLVASLYQMEMATWVQCRRDLFVVLDEYTNSHTEKTVRKSPKFNPCLFLLTGIFFN